MGLDSSGLNYTTEGLFDCELPCAGAFQQHGDRLKGRLLEKNKKIKMGIQKKMWKCTEMHGNAPSQWMLSITKSGAAAGVAAVRAGRRFCP